MRTPKSGDWLRYIETRLSGFEKEEATTTVYTQGKDREVFADYYASAQVTLEASASARRCSSVDTATERSPDSGPGLGCVIGRPPRVVGR